MVDAYSRHRQGAAAERTTAHLFEEIGMTVDRYLRMIAGFFVMLSLALGHYVHPYFYFFTAFVGLNLFQSAFSNWCLMKTMLLKLGIPDCVEQSSTHRVTV